ncbi:MAG: nucleoside triphosphate pyrophosphohydrolase [Deltaproteobacteria bacterium]|nr:nucleoside triphosphate pyrophosphohydrolase [Deltaproteobacteria bacterium]
MPKIDRLLQLMARLRDPAGGCPWDLAQSFATIAPYTIEEAYEVDDAIRRAAWPELCDELGDLLLQVVFHAQIAREAGLFDFDDVVEAISAKLVRRHPNVFGDARVETAAEQSLAWDAHKAAEREARGVDDLDAVPRALPALMQAAKLARRADRAGRRSREGEPIGAADETAVGDALFELARGAALRGIDPETALRRACERFRARAPRG